MEFERDVWQYGYHVQAAFYCTVLGFPIENFRFIAVKNNIEYDDPRHPETMVRVCKLNDRMIEVGFEKMYWAFDRWKEYILTGKAPEIDAPTDDLGIEIL